MRPRPGPAAAGIPAVAPHPGPRPSAADQRRPGPHDPVPGREDLPATLPPARRIADGPAVVEGEGRLVGPEVVAELSRGLECRRERPGPDVVELAQTCGRGDRVEHRDHDQAHDEGDSQRTRHRFDLARGWPGGIEPVDRRGRYYRPASPRGPAAGAAEWVGMLERRSGRESFGREGTSSNGYCWRIRIEGRSAGTWGS
jgi:hypothetical protein